ncbi:MAG: hypothetical protein Q8N26_27320 [Myxococcales bacterium]|nr:hypothetical protein [Myxococcales bacterium]
MPGFRVTKYDPQLRDASGAFLGDDWISVSDIGKAYGGRTLTRSEYLLVELKYVAAVVAFMEVVRVDELTISDLERRDALQARLGDLGCADVLENGRIVRGTQLECVVRAALREAAWFRLSGSNGAYVHFGFDYYMYVGSTLPVLHFPKLPTGLFAERMASPYWADEE